MISGRSASVTAVAELFNLLGLVYLTVHTARPVIRPRRRGEWLVGGPMSQDRGSDLMWRSIAAAK
jgi:hypothetical protein